jgi:hypothetical protein
MVDIGDTIHRGIEALAVEFRMSPERLVQNAMDAADVAETSLNGGDVREARAWAAISDAWSKAAASAQMVIDAQPIVRAEEFDDMTDESFQDWTRRQLEKLAAQLRDIQSDREQTDTADMKPGWYERTPLSVYRVPTDEDDSSPLVHVGRIMWCLMYLSGGDSVVIPQHVWDESGGGNVTVTMRADGGRLVRRQS